MGQATWQRVQRKSSTLSTQCVRAMEALPWFGVLPAEQRSYVGLVLQAGLSTFAQWLRYPDQPLPVGPEVFAAAPRDLARVVNLKQTVQLIRVAVGVIEQEVPALAAPGDEGGAARGGAALITGLQGDRTRPGACCSRVDAGPQQGMQCRLPRLQSL